MSVRKITVRVKPSFSMVKARNAQLRMAKRIIIEDQLPKRIRFVAGVDVAYIKDYSIGAATVLDYASLKLIESKTAVCRTHFPYIPTYLSFRELPIIEKLSEKLESKPTVLIVDGNGVLHPYEFGLASHFGVNLGISSIGVAKNMLCGSLENNIVKMNNNKVGYALFSSKKVKKPVYVSPGHRISFKTSLDVVRHFSFFKIHLY